MKKIITWLLLLTVFLFGVGFAPATGYRWRDHAPPFDFYFGNHIDVHQQSKLNKNGTLEGFLYVKFTGEYTADSYPIAMHANCTETPDGCSVGWVLHGIPVRATFLGHQEGKHPQWYIDPANMPRQQGYSHFHWLGQPEHADGLTVGAEYDGYLLKLTARDTFFFEHHGGYLVTPGIDKLTHANVVTELD